MDPLTVASVAANVVSILEAARTVVPPGRRRRRASRSDRQRAYLAFQRAALNLATWPAYLPVVEVVGRNKITDRATERGRGRRRPRRCSFT